MSALRHFARRCASSLNTARGLASKAPRKKTGSGKKTAAKAAASAPSPGDESPNDHAAGTEDVDGTIGAEADKAAQAAKEAAGDVKVAVKLMVKREREAAAAKPGVFTGDW